MATIILNEKGGVPSMQIGVDQNHHYAYKIFIMKADNANNTVVPLEIIDSSEFQKVGEPFSLRRSPAELHDSKIVWIVFIWSDDSQAIARYTVTVKFKQDDKDVPPPNVPEPRKGKLGQGQAIEHDSVFVFSIAFA